MHPPLFTMPPHHGSAPPGAHSHKCSISIFSSHSIASAAPAPGKANWISGFAHELLWAAGNWCRVSEELSPDSGGGYMSQIMTALKLERVWWFYCGLEKKWLKSNPDKAIGFRIAPGGWKWNQILLELGTVQAHNKLQSFWHCSKSKGKHLIQLYLSTEKNTKINGRITTIYNSKALKGRLIFWLDKIFPIQRFLNYYHTLQKACICSYQIVRKDTALIIKYIKLALHNTFTEKQ